MSEQETLSQSRVQQIHAAALTCFARKGYHKATMDDIVAESGLSKGALYWYFPSKKDLFISLLEEMMRGYGEEWQMLVSTEEMGAVEKLAASLAFFKSEIDRMAPLVNILLEAWALLRHDEAVANQMKEFYLPFVNLIEGILEQGMDEGVFKVESPADTAAVIVTLFDGILLATASGIEVGDWGAIIEAAEKLILRGLEAGHT